MVNDTTYSAARGQSDPSKLSASSEMLQPLTHRLVLPAIAGFNPAARYWREPEIEREISFGTYHREFLMQVGRVPDLKAIPLTVYRVAREAPEADVIAALGGSSGIPTLSELFARISQLMERYPVRRRGKLIKRRNFFHLGKYRLHLLRDLYDQQNWKLAADKHTRLPSTLSPGDRVFRFGPARPE